jgi:hypothetical protein
MVEIQLVSRISESLSGHLIFRILVRAFFMNATSVAYRYLPTGYTFASPTNDGLASFNLNNAPAYLFSTIKDIQSVNPGIKVHLLPWSPVSTYFSPFKTLCLPLSFSPRG